MKKQITKFLILTIILTTALSVNYLFAAWVGPTQAPPDGNTPTPIHVGSVNQVKDGGLSVNALSVFGKGYFQGSVQVGNSGSNPQAGEIRWTGSDLEVYKVDTWVSLTSTDGGDSGPAVDPNYTDCINAGGSWVDAQSTCYVPGTSCPSGWSPNANYSTTQSASCSGSASGTASHYNCPVDSCSTGSHLRANTAPETCTYERQALFDNIGGSGCYIPYGNTGTCTATKTEIGCTKN